MKLIPILLLLFLCLTAMGRPWASIKGGIYYCTSKEPAAIMALRLESVTDAALSYHFSTDEHGHFFLSGIRPGEYVLRDDGGYANMDFSVGRIVLGEAEVLEIDTIWTMNAWGTPIGFDYFKSDYLPRISFPNEYARAYARLAEASAKYYYGAWDDKIPLRSLLPLVKVPRDMTVCAIRGRLYLRKTEITNRYDGVWEMGQSVFVSDDNNQLQPYVEVLEANPYYDDYPYALEGVEVPFTQAGIWQAYLLHRTDTWMSCWGCRGGSVCLFSQDALSLIYPTEGRCSCHNYRSMNQQLQDAIPQMVTRVDILSPDTAMVTATYYNLGLGSIELQHWLAIRSGETVSFQKQESKVLYRKKVKYICDELSW